MLALKLLLGCKVSVPATVGSQCVFRVRFFFGVCLSCGSNYCSHHKDDPFSMQANLCNKLAYLTPWYTHTCVYQEIRNNSFLKKLRTYQIDNPLLLLQLKKSKTKNNNSHNWIDPCCFNSLFGHAWTCLTTLT